MSTPQESSSTGPTIRTDLSGTKEEQGNTTRTLRGDLRGAPADPKPAKPKVGLPVGGIPGYAVSRRIGAGGMGQVYEATRESDGRAVALKLLRADAIADPEFRERFQREATVMQQVSHQNVVGYVDAGEVDGWLYIGTELMRDGDLDRYLKRRGQLFEKDALTLMLKIISGVVAIHAAGLVHRDLKPQNIFLDHRATDGGDVKVGDLGMARHESGEDRMTMTGTACGTPAYMAPEQLRGEAAIDHRADVYALGVMLYTLLAGREPFIGDTAFTVSHAALKDQAPDLGRFCQVSPATAAIVRQAMRKDRTERYQDAAALATDCKRALAGERPLQAGIIEATSPISTTTLKANAAPARPSLRGGGGGILHGLSALMSMGPLFKILVIGIPIITGLTWLSNHMTASDHAPGTRKSGLTATAPIVDGSGTGVTVTIAGDAFPLRWIPPGTFTMGSPLQEPGRVYWEDPHPVILRTGYWILAHEVSAAQYAGTLSLPIPAPGQGALPMTNVTRSEAEAFCAAVSKRLGVTARLPTEAEWERAARADDNGPFAVAISSEVIATDADVLNSWQQQIADSHPNETLLWDTFALTQRITSKPRMCNRGIPNRWGISDMHGNVQEWVSDRWNHRDRWGDQAVTDPESTVGPLTVVRGGSWMHPPARARSATRDAMDGDQPWPWIGFRFVIVGGNKPEAVPSE